jgi:formate--tetrahydrofolate ligase
MAALLRDALWPNLVQTLEGTPALVHGGPFANIAHGCNSITATRMAMALGDICVTEAGFGADLGAEKFLDIKCRQAGIFPNCAVVVATVRALKHHGGCDKARLGEEDLDALLRGLPNLRRHVENMRNVYGLPVVVALNHFATDTQAELNQVAELCAELGVPCHLADGWAKGGAGSEDLAREVLSLCEKGSAPTFCYPDDMPLDKKIRAVAQRVYRADKVTFAPGVLTQLRKMDQNLLVCIAKTQYSFSDDPKKLGAPDGHTLTIRRVALSAGAGFVVAFAGDIIAMPGLPPHPAAEDIDVGGDGVLQGIF